MPGDICDLDMDRIVADAQLALRLEAEAIQRAKDAAKGRKPFFGGMTQWPTH